MAYYDISCKFIDMLDNLLDSDGHYYHREDLLILKALIYAGSSVLFKSCYESREVKDEH